MIKREPERNRKWADGMPGGLNNPLGRRALYLYANGADTLYRIHGTSEPHSIGTAVSSGCIRLFNQDIIDLFNRVPVGTPVVVLNKKTQNPLLMSSNQELDRRSLKLEERSGLVDFAASLQAAQRPPADLSSAAISAKPRLTAC